MGPQKVGRRKSTRFADSGGRVVYQSVLFEMNSSVDVKATLNTIRDPPLPNFQPQLQPSAGGEEISSL